MILRPIVVGLRAAGVAGLILYSSFSSAAALRMNGMAEYESLGETVFVAALQAQTPKNTPFDLANDALPARMEYRFLKDGYRKRTFQSLLKEAVVSNNDPQVLNSLLTPGGALEKLLAVGGNLQTFTTGDIITIDYDGTNTTAAFNGAVFVSEKGKDIFNVILNTWVGSSPPSARFKGDILTLGSGALFDETKEMYSILIPTEARKVETMLAVGGTKQINPVDSSTQVASAAGAEKAPAAAAPVAVAVATTPAVPTAPEKPTMDVASASMPDRPEFMDAPVVVTIPAEKPITKPADKPTVAATKPAAKPVAPDVVAVNKKPAQQPAVAPKPVVKPTPAEPVVVAVATPAKPVVDEAMLAAKQSEFKYKQIVKLAVTKKLEYPEKAVEMGWEDVVVLALVVAPDGSIQSAGYSKESQYEPLNKAAMRAARAAKLPANPGGKSPVEVLVPVRFTMAGQTV